MKKLIRITTVPLSLKILLKGQLGFMSQYYEVLAISSKNGLDDALLEQGVRGYGVEMTRQITPIKDMKALLQLIILFIKEKPDIIHTHTPKAGLLGMMAAWIVRVPVRLHTVAGLPLLIETGKKRILLEFVERVTYWCATKVYPNSFVMRDIIIDLHLLPTEKAKVIAHGSSNGIDTSYFSCSNIPQSCDTIRKQLQISQGDFVYIFIGRVVKDKGINELINAFLKMQKVYSSIKLIIVGPFEQELNPVDQNVENEIMNNASISFVGFQKDIRPYLMASDSLVFPSYREGFPNVVMQAGAMGLPAIVTDINGCNEIIHNDINGVIIPPKDEEKLFLAMKAFYEDRNKLKKLANNARSMIVERYEQRKVWEALLEEYKSFDTK